MYSIQIGIPIDQLLLISGRSVNRALIRYIQNEESSIDFFGLQSINCFLTSLFAPNPNEQNDILTAQLARGF
jgi:hypothetical protein